MEWKSVSRPVIVSFTAVLLDDKGNKLEPAKSSSLRAAAGENEAASAGSFRFTRWRQTDPRA